MAGSNLPAPKAGEAAVQLTRLLKRSQFLELKENGRRVQTPAFVCQWQNAPQNPNVSIGFTASSRGVGNAVQRNRARRRLKAALQQVTRGALLSGGKNLAFIAKQNILELEFKYLVKDIQKTLEQSGVISRHEEA